MRGATPTRQHATLSSSSRSRSASSPGCAQERRQGRQFEALGLTAEGRAASPERECSRSATSAALEDQVKGTVLDTAKTKSALRADRERAQGSPASSDANVRLAIKGMLDDIAAAPSTRTARRQVARARSPAAASARRRS